MTTVSSARQDVNGDENMASSYDSEPSGETEVSPPVVAPEMFLAERIACEKQRCNMELVRARLLAGVDDRSHCSDYSDSQRRMATDRCQFAPTLS